MKPSGAGTRPNVSMNISTKRWSSSMSRQAVMNATALLKENSRTWKPRSPRRAPPVREDTAEKLEEQLENMKRGKADWDRQYETQIKSLEDQLYEMGYHRNFEDGAGPTSKEHLADKLNEYGQIMDNEIAATEKKITELERPLRKGVRDERRRRRRGARSRAYQLKERLGRSCAPAARGSRKNKTSLKTAISCPRTSRKISRIRPNVTRKAPKTSGPINLSPGCSGNHWPKRPCIT